MKVLRSRFYRHLLCAAFLLSLLHFFYTRHQLIVDRTAARFGGYSTALDFLYEGSICQEGRIVGHSPIYFNKSNIAYCGWFPCYYDAKIDAHSLLSCDDDENYDPAGIWYLRGSYGFVVIEFEKPLLIEYVEYQHLLHDLTDILSMPKTFSFMQLNATIGDDMEAGILRHQDDFSPNATSYKKRFKLANPHNQPVNKLIINVVTNHGNTDYTKVCRFQIFGRKLVEQ